MDWLIFVGTLASFALPFFNIPLVFRMVKRKSADDISLVWVIGVWVSIVLMTPAALFSKDFAFKLFGVTNLVFFSLVTFFSLKYRLAKKIKQE